jgi:high-affinity Fe2+/Pb2+ permease
MDYSSPVISLLIVWYGVYEYRRREKAHSAAMENLRHGLIPAAAGSKPPSWSLLTTGSVCSLLAVFAGTLFYTGVHLRNNYGRPLEIMGCLITLPLVILLMIFVRDLRRYAAAQHGQKEYER